MTQFPRFLSRRSAALAVGRLAYGVFYLSVAALLIGLPVGVAWYLVGLLSG